MTIERKKGKSAIQEKKQSVGQSKNQNESEKMEKKEQNKTILTTML